MRRLLALGAVLATFAVLGCSGKNPMVARVAPETTVFVQGAVDTVNHVVELFWYGTDTDGFVTAYELRLLNPAAPAESAWVRTTRTDSLFTVFTPTGATNPVFEVRAIDNDGLVDASPARQQFFFDNAAPTVVIGPYPVATDTTYASMTFSWTANDPDGESTLMRFRVWLDGNEANAHILTGTKFTVPTTDFIDGSEVRAGTRTVFVQAIDDGGLAGSIASRNWIVRPTVTGPPGTRARLLLIDDVPASNNLNLRTDTLWLNAVANNYPVGSWSVLKLASTQPFRSDEDARQTFSLYDAVVWYRGNQQPGQTSLAGSYSPVLDAVQDGIEAAIDDGHSFVIEGLNLTDGIGRFNPMGSLDEDFLRRVFDVDYQFKYLEAGQPDSSVEWGAGTGDVFYTANDSLRLPGILLGLRAFAANDPSHILLTARANTLSQGHDFDIPVALSVPKPSGSRAVIITFPVVVASQPAPDGSFPQRATAFLGNVLRSVLKPGL